MSEPTRLYAQAIEALNRGEWARARTLAAPLLAQAPRHAGIHFVIGVASLQLQQLQAALHHLQAAVAINPHRPDYATQLARALATGRFFREAVAAADQAMASSPDDAMGLDTLGIVYTQANAHEKAARVFLRAVQLAPGQASYRFNLATSLTFAGDVEGAAREYEACIAIEPRYWKAHLALSQLRRQSESKNNIARLESLLPQAVGDSGGTMYLNLALSKEYEDLAQFPRAFQHLVSGKSVKGRDRGYKSDRDRSIFEALQSS
ncbi:MAG: tetratricopeptide repeat protein, partial [Proteobacteria bacterium]